MTVFKSDKNVVEFLEAHIVAIIGSVDEQGQPHTSPIYYAYNDDVFYFVTKSETKKTLNFTHNPAASFTVFDSKSMKSINLIGSVRTVELGDEHTKWTNIVLKMSHQSQDDFAPIVKLHKGTYVLFKFIPRSGVFTNFASLTNWLEQQNLHYQD